MAYPKVNGVPLDQIFDPYVAGTKAIVTGYTVKVGGVATDLRDLFAPIYLGSSAPPTKYKVNNADLNTLFAAKGTAVYTFSFNGYNASSSRTRAAATITLKFNSNGTWQVIKDMVVSGDPGTVILSGNWLVYGGTASDYSVQFVTTGLTDGPDPGGGTDTLVNQASTQKSMNSGNYYALGGCVAVVVGNDARNYGSISAKLYKNGVLINTSTLSVATDSNGGL